MQLHTYDELGFRRYLCTRTEPQLAANTIKDYCSYARRWADHAIDAATDPYELDPIEVREWSSRLPRGKSTRDMARSALLWLARWADTDETRVNAVELIKGPRKPKWRSLRPSVVARVLEAADGAGEIGTAIYLALYTAMRVSEVVAVRWEKVDLERMLITFDRRKTKDELTLPIHPQLAERLASRATAEGWLFPGRNGGHLTAGAMGQRIRRLLDPLNLDQHVTFHPLRHTCATLVFEATGNLLMCQQLLGHARPETTARYVRVHLRQLRSAIATIDYSPGLPEPDWGPQWAA